MRFSEYERGRCILVTGAAGFIGFHLINRLIKDDWFVIGTDNINDYYDQRLKYARLAELGIPKVDIEYNKLIPSRYYEKLSFFQLNLEDTEAMNALFDAFDIKVVCHLGAQAGVRYSLENPLAYVNSNVVGFTNILENCRRMEVEHLVYASSSSVYGSNSKQPFSTADRVDHPVSFYAATKKANELMAHVYSHLYQLPTTGLRFFTVYGPWGRPDMSPMLFADAIMNDKPLKVFNNGQMARDFTYVDDIIDGIETILKSGPLVTSLPDSLTVEECKTGPSNSLAAVYNIGRGEPVNLLDYIVTLEKALGKTAQKTLMPMQPGDVVSTYCDVTDLARDYGYKPSTALSAGLKAFASWYKEWYTGSKPLIAKEKVVVGRFPFPSVMNWHYVWSCRLDRHFGLSDKPDELLKCLIATDGFDEGLSAIDLAAWKAYVKGFALKFGLKKTDRLFEVGCGGGAFLYPLYKLGYSVAGLDYASNMVQMASLVMPDGSFVCCEASALDTVEEVEVVLANSVFQYFGSLAEAESVLIKMLNKATRMVGVLNIPATATKKLEWEACEKELPLGMYEKKYKGLTHLFYDKRWFRAVAMKQGYSVRFYTQSIKGYGMNDFRFNAVFTKLESNTSDS
jgi:UDP-glucuronate 4-epimerase